MCVCMSIIESFIIYNANMVSILNKNIITFANNKILSKTFTLNLKFSCKTISDIIQCTTFHFEKKKKRKNNFFKTHILLF